MQRFNSVEDSQFQTSESEEPTNCLKIPFHSCVDKMVAWHEILSMFMNRAVCCYICDSKVSPASTDNCLLDGKKKWAKSTARKIYYQAAELDELLYISEHHWSQFFRAIYRSPQTGQYHLSGIGQYAGSQTAFLLPRDRDKGVVGPTHRPTKHRVTVKLAPLRSKELPQRRRDVVGYAVHSRCWKLVERAIGRSAAERHLDVLMKALHQRFRELGFGTTQSLKDIACVWDPYKSKAVWDIVMRSSQRGRQCIHRSRTLSSSSQDQQTFSVEGHRRTHPTRQSRIVCRPATVLPLEIQWEILDLLDTGDILIMQRAIEWPIADVYWRSRAPRNLLFELEDFSEASLDWRYICVSLMKMESSRSFDWLKNRQRVLDVIDGTRRVFERDLESLNSV